MMRPRICAFRRSASPYFFGGEHFVPFVAKTRMRLHRESEIAFPRPLRERTDRAQRDQVRAQESLRLPALTRRAASRRTALSRKGRGQNSASGACGEFSL